MDKKTLEKLFEIYLKQGYNIYNDNKISLLKIAQVNLLQSRNILLYLQDNLEEEIIAYKRSLEISKYKTKTLDEQLNNLFIASICVNKETIIENTLKLENLIEQEIENHNLLLKCQDYPMYPYHYAITALITLSALNQENYNDELARKAKCFQNKENFQLIYSDQSKVFIPFIEEKIENIIIDDSLLKDPEQKIKKFPS